MPYRKYDYIRHLQLHLLLFLGKSTLKDVDLEKRYQRKKEKKRKNKKEAELLFPSNKEGEEKEISS